MFDIRSNKRRNVRMNIILRSVRVTITAVKNNKHYMFRVCACILSYLAGHEERMFPFILSPVACLALPYFFTLSYKRNDCRKKILKGKCLL